jgi:hypothetical protein
MKKAIVFGGIVLGGLVGVLLVTNPSQEEYEEYGAEQIITYLRENVCNQLPSGLEGLLQNQACKTLVDIGSPQLPRIIEQNTKRYNYLLFSIYKTDLYLYKFETVGIVQNFYTYQMEKMETKQKN